MFLVHNEQTKLTANWLNTIATATIATGALAPVAASIYGVSQLKGRAPESAPPTKQTELTVRARDLHENSSMPVREIAALVGVTERTLYKWARKGNWKPRYRWMPDGSRPPARHGARPRLTAQALDRMQRFAPVKGAGGRFISRADRDRPVLRGIKATDPAAHARALVGTVEAARLNAAAEHDAALALARDDRLRALTFVHQTLRKLAQHRDDHAQQQRERLQEQCRWAGLSNAGSSSLHPDGSNDPAEGPLHISLNAAADWLDDAQQREGALREKTRGN